MGTSFYPAQGGGGGSSYITAVASSATVNLSVTSSILSADIASASLTNALISPSAGIVYSKLALTNSILNADINASAGIVYSKLSLTNSIVNADINSSAAISYSKLSLTGSIIDADINASAAIVDTKLATISTAGKVSNSATTATSTNTASAIVARDASGDFSAGTITATLLGNASTATTATSFSGSLSGDVTGTQGATVISSPTVTGKLISGFISGSGTVTDTDTILQALQKLDGNVALRAPIASPTFTGTVTISGLATGLLKSTSGVLSSSLLVDADVSASAAIAGTKISPAFGSQNISTTGTGSVASLSVTGTAGAGFLQLANQSSTPATPTSSLRLASGGTGNFVLVQTNGFAVAFDTVSNTATRVYTFPDATLTLTGLDTTQTLTNKTIALGSNTVNGRTSGVAPAAGVIGEVINVSSGISSAGTGTGYTTVATLALTAGSWQIDGRMRIVTGGSATVVSFSLATTAGTTGFPELAYGNTDLNVVNCVDDGSSSNQYIGTLTSMVVERSSSLNVLVQYNRVSSTNIVGGAVWVRATRKG